MLKRFSRAFNELVFYNQYTSDWENPKGNEAKAKKNYTRNHYPFYVSLLRTLQAALFQLTMAFGRENLDYYYQNPEWYTGNLTFSKGKLAAFFVKVPELFLAFGFKLIDSAFKLPRRLISNLLDWTAWLRQKAWSKSKGLGWLASVVFGCTDAILHVIDAVLFVANEMTQLALDFVRGIFNAIASPFSSFVKPAIQAWKQGDRITKALFIGLALLCLGLTAALIVATLASGGALLAPLTALLAPAFHSVASALGTACANAVFVIGALLAPPIVGKALTTFVEGLFTTWNNAKAYAKELFFHSLPSFLKGDSPGSFADIEAKILNHSNMSYLETQAALSNTQEAMDFYPSWNTEGKTLEIDGATSSLMFGSYLHPKPNEFSGKTAKSPRDRSGHPGFFSKRTYGDHFGVPVPLFDCPAPKSAFQSSPSAI